MRMKLIQNRLGRSHRWPWARGETEHKCVEECQWASLPIFAQHRGGGPPSFVHLANANTFFKNLMVFSMTSILALSHPSPVELTTCFLCTPCILCLSPCYRTVTGNAVSLHCLQSFLSLEGSSGDASYMSDSQEELVKPLEN